MGYISYLPGSGATSGTGEPPGTTAAQLSADRRPKLRLSIIFSATAVLIIATTVQVGLTWLITGKVEKRLLWLFCAVVLFGGATLVLRDQTFIQWKPTVFNWVLALVFGGSQLFSDKTLLERTLGKQLQLPKPVWTRLNLLWVANFTLVGSLNLVVAYNYTEATWVSYKLYSAFGFTLLLTILTALLIAPHIKEEQLPNNE